MSALLKVKWAPLAVVLLLSTIAGNASGEILSTVTDLGTLGGTISNARDINNSGQIVGVTYNSSGLRRAFLWESGSGMQDLGTLGGLRSYALGINNSAQIVGYAEPDIDVNHAFLWEDGTGMVDLNCLISSSSGWRDPRTQRGTRVQESGRGRALSIS